MMTREELGLVMRYLGITLPEPYQSVMLNYNPINPDAEWGLLNEPNSIIEYNSQLRSDGFFGLHWPPHYFCVGDDGSGNVYFIDTSELITHAYFGDHENSEYVRIHDDFREWCRSTWGTRS